MLCAVRIILVRLGAAKTKILLLWIAEGPPACVPVQLHQRAFRRGLLEREVYDLGAGELLA